MSLTPQLRAALQRDAVASTKRWSLRALAHMPALQQHYSATAETSTSHTLLQCAVQRLAAQHAGLQNWIDDIVRETTRTDGAMTAATLPPPSRRRRTDVVVVLKWLETLQYVHADTYRLGRRLLDNRDFWERWEAPDQHLANATVLELRARHANTLERVVDVVTELRNHHPGEEEDANTSFLTRMHHHADVFLQRRLGIQLLCDHHVELYKGVATGAVSVNAPLSAVLTDAVLEAQHTVDVHLQIYPETLVYPHNTDASCTLVRPWVHHALVEVLKNGMASTVQQMQNDASSSTTPAPIEIYVEDDEKNRMVLEIVDRGTGIPGGDAAIEDAFLLGHSSVGQKWDRLHEQQSYAAVRSPLCSLGVGLPASRYMMEHFGGALTLRNNSEHPGCTARIELPTDDTLLERIPGRSPEGCKIP